MHIHLACREWRCNRHATRFSIHAKEIGWPGMWDESEVEIDRDSFIGGDQMQMIVAVVEQKMKKISVEMTLRFDQMKKFSIVKRPLILGSQKVKEL
jgi:hypothetical protein